MDTDSSDQLAARLSAADRGEALPPAPGGADLQQPPPPDAGAPYREAVIYYGGVVRECLPERVSRHWTDERLARVGHALARCAIHYKWDFAAQLNHPVAGLVVSLLPLGWPIAEPYVMPHMKALAGKPSANDAPRPAPQPAPAAAPVAAPKAAPIDGGLDNATGINAAGVDVGVVHLVTPPAPHRVAPLEGDGPIS